ncbi:MOS4-associated complex 3B [Striga asiatica]|uniref:MOS4-associated complex 3B n=1 Tax=Striga asiatica TaxID=4170 RepID=A0A5A7R7T5_STRAF|nr:MOS4-associated complex 3B [Striga asiatica]
MFFLVARTRNLKPDNLYNERSGGFEKSSRILMFFTAKGRDNRLDNPVSYFTLQGLRREVGKFEELLQALLFFEERMGRPGKVCRTTVITKARKEGYGYLPRCRESPTKAWTFYNKKSGESNDEFRDDPRNYYNAPIFSHDPKGWGKGTCSDAPIGSRTPYIIRFYDFGVRSPMLQFSIRRQSIGGGSGSRSSDDLSLSRTDLHHTLRNT